MQIDKLVTTLQKEQVDISSGSKSQLLKRNNSQRNIIHNSNNVMLCIYVQGWMGFSSRLLFTKGLRG